MFLLLLRLPLKANQTLISEVFLKSGACAESVNSVIPLLELKVVACTVQAYDENVSIVLTPLLSKKAVQIVHGLNARQGSP